MRNLLAAVIVVAGATCATQTFAQNSGLSAEQIIRSLTPTGDVSKVATRGIRMAPQSGTADAVTMAPASETPRTTAHAMMAAAKPVSSASAPADATPRTANLTVNFATGSANLTPHAMQALDALGTALSSETLSNYRFRIEGHTDNVGAPDANRILSEQRAQTVVQYISSKFGIAGTRLESVGMGSDKQLIATGPQIAEPRNRRVLIVNLGT